MKNNLKTHIVSGVILTVFTILGLGSTTTPSSTNKILFSSSQNITSSTNNETSSERQARLEREVQEIRDRNIMFQLNERKRESDVALANEIGVTEKDFEFIINQQSNGIIVNKYVGLATTVQIPEYINGLQVKVISESSFKDTKVISVIFPNSIQEIGNNAFDNVPLESITLPDNINISNTSFPDNFYWFYENSFNKKGGIYTYSYKLWDHNGVKPRVSYLSKEQAIWIHSISGPYFRLNENNYILTSGNHSITTSYYDASNRISSTGSVTFEQNYYFTEFSYSITGKINGDKILFTISPDIKRLFRNGYGYVQELFYENSEYLLEYNYAYHSQRHQIITSRDATIAGNYRTYLETWNSQTGRAITSKMLDNTSNVYSSIGYSPDGRQVYLYYRYKNPPRNQDDITLIDIDTIRIFNTSDLGELFSISAYENNNNRAPASFGLGYIAYHYKIKSYKYSPDSNYIMVVFDDNILKIFSIIERKEILQFPVLNDFSFATYTPDGERILVGYNNNHITIYDVITGNQMENYQIPEGYKYHSQSNNFNYLMFHKVDQEITTHYDERARQNRTAYITKHNFLFLNSEDKEIINRISYEFISPYQINSFNYINFLNFRFGFSVNNEDLYIALGLSDVSIYNIKTGNKIRMLELNNEYFNYGRLKEYDPDNKIILLFTDKNYFIQNILN